MIPSSAHLLRPVLLTRFLPAPSRSASSSALGARPSSKSSQTRPPIAPPRKPRPYKPTTRSPASSASTSSPPPPESLLTLWRRSWLPLSGAALVAGCLGFYIVGTVAASVKRPSSSAGDHASHQSPPAPTGRPPALTGNNAHLFDKNLDFDEWWMGITRLRRQLAHLAKGHVLEVATGTGRNLPYYDWTPMLAAAAEAQPGGGERQDAKGKNPSSEIASYTGLDINADMLRVARKRLSEVVPLSSSASSAPFQPPARGGSAEDTSSYLDNRLRFVRSDIHHDLPLPATASPSPERGSGPKYDTIIQTFGLCSVSDPVSVLCNLASALQPGTGRILLLEHGKGWYGIVNGLLDKNAGKHFAKYGCWWNRDIEALVDEAVRKTPGLEVVSLKRPNIFQLGTLVWVELRMAGSP